MRNLLRWLPVISVLLWAILNLLCLQTWPNLMAFGDEAWFSDVAWSLAERFRLANTIFPYVPLENGLGLVAETLYYIPLAIIFRIAGVGLFQARLLSLLAAAATILILAYRLRGTRAWIAVAVSPSLLITAHTARPEALGITVLTIYLLLVIADAWVLVGIVGGLSFFVSPVVGLWASGAFLAWLILSRGWKKKILAAALFGLACLVGLGLNAVVGGPGIISYEGYADYYVPVIQDQNPLFLLKAVAKKTYWPYVIRFKDPVVTLLLASGAISAAIRRFRVRKEEQMIWAFAAFGVMLTGLGISRTPDYYFAYLLVPVAFAGGLGLRPLRQVCSLAIVAAIGFAGLGKTILDARGLPPSDPPSAISAFRDEIPDGAGVIGPTNLWYVLRNKRLIVPLFGDVVTERNEFLARLNSLSPGFLILTDRDESGWLCEMAAEGELVREVSFRGYIVSSETGSPEPIREIALYRLKPAESEAGRHEAGDR